MLVKEGMVFCNVVSGRVIWIRFVGGGVRGLFIVGERKFYY